MGKTGILGRSALVGLAFVALTGLTGCGQLTIRTWVKVVSADSSGSVTIAGGKPLPLSPIQGGFLATIVMDTSTLPGPIDGTITVDQIRLAAAAPKALGYYVCAWQNVDQPSTGTVHMDLFGGTGSTVLTTNLRATTGIGGGGIIAEVSTPAELDLQGDLLTAFTNAANEGTADGLFATRAQFEGDSSLAGIPAVFAMDLDVSNDSAPPVIDGADGSGVGLLLADCQDYFAEQGTALYEGVNSKGSYLRAWPGDDPKPPRVVALADLGVVPGDTLRLDEIGAYADTTALADGNLTTLTGVFSSTNQINGTDQRYRIPGAIDAGTDINTGGYWSCILIFCTFKSSDIPQDFRIDPGTTVVVPPGANYLFLAPLPPSRKWSDDTGFGFGVDVDVNPAS